MRRIGIRTHRVLLALGVVLLLALVKTFPLWEDVSNRGFDLLSTIGQPVPEAPGVVVVAIDEPSFSEIGLQWPWPRDLHAELIENLRTAGARAIAFDVVFAEGADPAADARLASVAGPDIVFAADESLTQNDFGETLIRTEPFPALLAASARSGVVSIGLDGDGVARHVPHYPDAFARQLLGVAGHTAADDAGGDRIQYFGPAGSYPRISYYQALDPGRFLPPDMLRDAVVIIGYNLQASPEVGEPGVDIFESPYTLTTRRLMSGPEIHATIYDNLLHRLSIADAPAWLGWIALIAGAMAGLLASRPPNLWRKVLTAIGLIAATIAISWLSLRFGRVWISPAEPLFAVALTVTAIGARDFAAEQRRRREVHTAFSQYVSPDMVNRLVADPGLLKLGGEKKPITVLFADIRGFTTISEGMKDDPEALVHLINDILTPLTDIIIDRGGTIDKYMGDCVMAFWNAPLDDPDHARHAINAARAMIDALPAINAALAERLPPPEGGLPAIRIGIGINTGQCVVGNMGSKRRFDYSVLGDAVNVASRLEAKSKDYGVPIVVGEQTVAAFGDGTMFRKLDNLAVHGKRDAIDIFTVRRQTD